jgi:hypothetical protein
MKTIKISNKEIEIPTSWVDITFTKFNSFLKIIKSQKTEEEIENQYADMDEDIKDLQISLDNVKLNTSLVSFWTSLTEEEISLCDLEEVDSILKEMSFLNNTYEPIALSKFTFEDEVYHLPEIGMEKENFGTYIEAEQIEIHNQQLEKGNLDILPKQAAIICKKENEKRGLINDKLVEERAKAFERLDMATIWDIGFFLSQRESILMSNSLIYLKQEEMQKQLLQLNQQ